MTGIETILHHFTLYCQAVCYFLNSRKLEYVRGGRGTKDRKIDKKGVFSKIFGHSEPLVILCAI